MDNSRLWQTLCSLSYLERKHFGQWLRSPFFCRRQQPLALYNYLESCLRQGALPCREEALAALGTATAAAGRQALRQQMSALLAQAEHFLVYKEVFAAETEFHIRLAAAYRKRNLEKHFRQSLHTARSALNKLPFRHTEYFDTQAAIEYELYQHLTAGRRTEALNWQELSDQTDTAYISRMLRQACFALSHQTVYKTDYRFGLLDAVLAYVRHSGHLQKFPVIALYYYCYLFLTEAEAETHFLEFKNLLLTHLDRLPPDEQRNLHLFAINYCIRKINQLHSGYFREALDLYQSALKAKLLLENGHLSHYAYTNIVAIALKVGETDWAEQFIHEHVEFLEKKHRDAIFHLNLARVEYNRRRYKSALLHLQEADYKDLINNLIAKTLQLKIYYETEELDALDAHLQSMQTFIRRQRVIGYHKTNYLNIVRYARRLVQLNPNDAALRLALRRQVESESVLTEKEWFLDMLNA